MFPRRRTDQVYSTLQQVQRRITEQNGGATMPPGGPIKAMPPTAIPGNRPPVAFTLPSSVPSPAQAPVQADVLLTRTPADDIPALDDEPQPQTAPQLVSALRPTPVQAASAPSPNPPLYPPASGSRRYVIQVSSEMAMLIVALWIGSMVLCYVIGGKLGGAGAGAGLATGAAGSREVPAPPAVAERPLWILVLQSEVATPDVVKRYQLGVRQLNEWAQGPGAGSGLKPLFGLREPANGHIELVYGMVNGRGGLPEKDAKAHAFLTRPPQDRGGGGGYGQAVWMTVR
jgi:hypothetical protein